MKYALALVLCAIPAIANARCYISLESSKDDKGPATFLQDEQSKFNEVTRWDSKLGTITFHSCQDVTIVGPGPQRPVISQTPAKAEKPAEKPAPAPTAQPQQPPKDAPSVTPQPASPPAQEPQK